MASLSIEHLCTTYDHGRVKAVNDEYNLGENSPARFVAGFSIYDSPSKHVDIVAAP